MIQRRLPCWKNFRPTPITGSRKQPRMAFNRFGKNMKNLMNESQLVSLPQSSRNSIGVLGVCLVVAALLIGNSAARADDGRVDFRTLSAPPVVHVLESPELLELLYLTAEQSDQIKELFDDWKAKYLKAKQEYEARLRTRRNPIYGLSRDRPFHDSITELLDDEQFQKVSRLIFLWNASPVSFHDAFQFDDLKLSPTQYQQLHQLQVDWVLYALKNNMQFDHEFSRPSEERGVHRSVALREEYRRATKLAWSFKPLRDQRWKKILSADQARRWQERELEKIWGYQPFHVLLTDYSKREQGDIPQTGTIDDYIVPYFTPPRSHLNWSEDQLEKVTEIIEDFEEKKSRTDFPRDREARLKWFEQQHTKEIKVMLEIQTVMTPGQRDAWWDLLGQPAGYHMGLLKRRCLADSNGADVEK